MSSTLTPSYNFRNPTDDPQSITFRLKFPAEHAIYDGLVMEVNRRSLPIVSDKQGVSVAAQLGPHEMASLRVAYRSHGLESWRYRLGDEVAKRATSSSMSGPTSKKSTSR